MKHLLTAISCQRSHHETPTLFIIALLCVGASAAVTTARGHLWAEQESPASSKLAVVWTSGDRDVALKMVFMYTLNAKSRSWFNDVTLIVWGPSSKLLSEDAQLQTEVAKMKDAGIELVACRACADGYGVSERLEELGVEVKYMGVPPTEML